MAVAQQDLSEAAEIVVACCTRHVKLLRRACEERGRDAGLGNRFPPPDCSFITGESLVGDALIELHNAALARLGSFALLKHKGCPVCALVAAVHAPADDQALAETLLITGAIADAARATLN